ncbi:MAG: hypothetical protein H7138_06225 [Myxococcales bacterium]|nr:hypothetical protein [Myxococcales bacterium]
MNDPWTLFIAALSGQRTTTPSTWPARTVHRLDSYTATARASQQRHRSLPRESPASLGR